jgi:hypothetical protein
VTTSSAIATLTAAFDTTVPSTTLAADVAASVAVISWPSVPIEIVRAAGLHPRFIRGAATATPVADAHLEPGVFPNRLHQLVEAALSGRLSHAACLILPRTSDPDYKCFLYLRELARRGVVRTLPPVLLFDLLQSHGPEVPAYDALRVRELFGTLAGLTGRRASLDELRQETARANAARAALRRLVACRREAPRLTGAAAMPLLGAFWHVAPDDYVTLASEAADTIETHSPLDGPRVLVTGAPVDGRTLHDAIESHGAIVVAEAGPWGSGGAGRDVACDGDPIAALADRCREAILGPRTPVDATRRWNERALDEVDAVVVSLPPDDTVFGWDYPALRARLASRGIPHAVLHGDPHAPLTEADGSRLRSLVTAAPGREARHV